MAPGLSTQDRTKEKPCLIASRLTHEFSVACQYSRHAHSCLGDRRADRPRGQWDEVLADYPDLEIEDIRQALSYAAWLAQEEVVTA